MTRQKALALARKKFGPTAQVRDRGIDSSPEIRQSAKVALAAHPKLEKPDLHTWPEDATVGEFRAALAQHQREYKAWKARNDALFSQAERYRYEVSKKIMGGLFNEIKGQGDSWEEALQKAGVPLPARAPA